METIDGFKIKLQYSDKKGMMDAYAMSEFTQKAIKAVCEIKCSKGFGSGFFCKIPYTKNDNLLLPVLITAYHVFSQIDSYNNIQIIIDGEIKSISLEQRKIWNDEDIDFTCIEIKEKEDKIHTFFSLDDHALDNDNKINYYLNKKVIIYGIDINEKKVGFSNGTIEKIVKKGEGNIRFIYNCNAYSGCSGGCIVNQANNMVIGLHKGEIEMKGLNMAVSIRNIIQKLKNEEKNFSVNQ